MRVARVLTRLNLGGPARQVLASDPLLAARGHQLRVFAGTPGPGEGDLFDELSSRGVDVRRVPGLGRALTGIGDLRALARLRSEFADFEPDIVHTHASKAGALGRIAASRVPRAARVHTFHGHVLTSYFPPFISNRLVALERRFAQRTDRVLAVSHATAEDLLRLGVVREEQLMVCPPGVELDELFALDARDGALRELIGAGAEDLVVGVVGRLAEVKHPELALEVFRLLSERYPRLHLVFVGDGDGRRELEREIAALPAAERDRVHLVGARTVMAPVYADLDVVLSTSRIEGMPVALIEAGAAGLPVVATPVGGVPELVAHERTGYLGEDVTELAYGLDRLLADPAERKGCGQRARLRIEKRHSAKALADRLEALYTALLEGRA
ncbi:MAG: glycosyltransferase [Planctomycetes bacterium]|nr:glycosyltransferase [Planctomycetota bacterium]MCB9904176.1 glycosyltransferase [Planctomycetota bacterium]